MKRLISIFTAILLLAVCLCVAVTAADAQVAAMIGTENYETFAAALSNYPGTDAVITLNADVTESFTLDKDLKIDLAGHSITAEITYTSGTLTLCDTATDDYTVEDTEGFGTIAKADYIQPAQGYHMLNEEGQLSFHRVSTQLSSAVLRPSVAGVYFNSEFGGDEKIKEQISWYGVAFSVTAAPTAESILADTQFKTRTGFAADTWQCGENITGITSSVVENIMIDGNGTTVNSRNGSTQIYAVPYIQLNGDSVILGGDGSISLKDAVEYTSSNWSDMTETQINDILDMYGDFRTAMRSWDVQTIKDTYKTVVQDRPLKILTIGNSFSLDSTRYLREIALAEGTEDMTLGVLYYSGCSLSKHVDFLTANTAAYNYYYTDSTGAWKNSGGNGTATMLQGIQDQDWDIIVMQQASSSSGRADTYNEDMQTIIDYVKANCSNPDAIFAWNMTWAYPVEDIDTDDITTVNTTAAFQTYYNSDQMTMYNAICNAVKTKIATNSTFEYIFPVGTAVQNARSSWLGDPDLNRDYSHLSDYGRFMAAYVWYYVLTGKDVDTISLDKISKELRQASANRDEDIILTEQDKAVILESVKNAIENPYQLTQSQYTVAP